jgi:hypothetical protein
MMHTYSRCRRVLINSSRDAVCLRCLYSIDRGGGFDDEPEPGKRALSTAADVNAVAL